MGGKLTPGYCMSSSNGKITRKLKDISGLFGKVISLLIAEDTYVACYLLQGTSFGDSTTQLIRVYPGSVESCPTGLPAAQI
ncbi:hypothetical protein TNCV_4881311 [Trichonephila clavipes]|nr:hypothetical protein TNCV_4881311 [Trichonephila clavipes]